MTIILYSHEKGPMGGAPHTGPKMGPIFEVSVSQLHAKEHPGKLYPQDLQPYSSTVTNRE